MKLKQKSFPGLANSNKLNVLIEFQSIADLPYFVMKVFFRYLCCTNLFVEYALFNSDVVKVLS